MDCAHSRIAVKRTYLKRREDGGKLASTWNYCADCGAFISKLTTEFAFRAGDNFYSYWDIPKSQIPIGDNE